jgi:hypothetical protein
MAMSLDLKQNGIELRFDSRTQRLEMIRIYDLSMLELAYGSEDRVFRSVALSDRFIAPTSISLDDSLNL